MGQTTKSVQPAPSQSASIAPAEVAALRARGQAQDLIDVRTPAEHAAVHADGARLIPLDKLDPGKVLATRAAPAEPIYLLCKSGQRARKARDKFVAAGFTNVICVDGGTDAWIRAGLPVVRGQAVMSLERQVRVAAGSIVVIGVALGFIVHPGFFSICAFVGAGLVFSGVTDTCGMGMVLAKMPWNQRGGSC